MAKKGIEAAQLAEAGKRTDKISTKEYRFKDPYSAGQALLLARIYGALRCEGVRWSYRARVSKMIVVGYESDLERVDVLYASLVMQMMGQLFKVRPPSWSNESPAAYRRTWLEGFADTIGHRLRSSEAQAVTEASTEPGGSSTALVLASRRDRVTAAHKQMFPNLGPAKTRVRTGTGRAAGAAAGQRADMGDNTLGGQRGALPSS